jgi:hypothetical protein
VLLLAAGVGLVALPGLIAGLDELGGRFGTES